MSDFRSFAEIEQPNQNEILLSPDESHHLVRVNRARPGSEVIVFNGAGREWICRYSEMIGQNARLLVEQERTAPPPPGPIALAQAIPKGKTFEQIIRKATEIGVRKIFPIFTQRTEVKLSDNRSSSKTDKWIATAIEAAKQCGNSYLPEIAPAQSLETFLNVSALYDLKLIASLKPDAKNLRQLFNQSTNRPASSIWLVGPEGDFTDSEHNAAIEAGFHPVSLGPLVLRCDTAATYALSILSHELQNI